MILRWENVSQEFEIGSGGDDHFLAGILKNPHQFF